MISKVNNLTAAFRRGIQVRLILSLLPLLALAGNGCRVAQQTGQAVTSVVPGLKSPPPPDPAALQTEVLHYADSFASQTSAALDEYAHRVNTSEARLQALNWKLSLGSSALGIATSPNPTANLLDFVTLTTLLHSSLEEQAPKAVPPGALDGWLGASRILETNAWKLAERTLTTDQQAQLLVAIDRWRSENPTNGATFLTRPQEVTALIRQAGEKERRPGSVFSWVGLDPMSGLDPAVREVTRTRLFAERALFAAERMPVLLSWQIELMSDQLLRQQRVNDALQSVDRFSRAAESASQTAALLPNQIANERKAVLDALETQEGKLRDLSAQVGQTLSAGEKMSTSLNTTLATFDALMKRFGVGEPSTTPPDTNSPPFNILDYAHTAEQVGTMAGQLDALLKDASGTVEAPALDKRIAQLDALATRARDNARSLLNHAFLLAVGLIVLSFACALLYRRLGRTTNRPNASGSADLRSP
jgi:hypothetical protein